jgi:pyruvate dehydrogenase E2 component (dihydrolipoamide acetyltransferase)
MATPVIMPRQGQSVETCIISEWFKKPGDDISEGDILLSYETDKAAFDLEAPASGKLLQVFYPEGDEVPVLTNIAVIGNEGEDIAEFTPESAQAQKEIKFDNTAPDRKTAQSTPEKEPVKVTAPFEGEIKTRISPRARIMAQKNGIEVDQLTGSGPYGRIIARDIEKAMTAGHSVETKPEIAHVPVPDSTTTNEFEVVPLTNIRRIIAEKMHASLQNSAQLTHHTSADARNIQMFRQQFKQEHQQGNGENITLNDMVCFATIKALRIRSDINSHFLGNEIRKFHPVHLGIAVDTERGLMVPSLKNAHAMSLSQLSASLKSLANQCRQGKIDPELLSSTASTFTVSNLGVYDIEMFTPILNIPQAGILGVNTIIKRPADLGGGVIGFIPFIGLSLTYDHRAIDGAPASAFLKEVKEQIENFEYDL